MGSRRGTVSQPPGIEKDFDMMYCHAEKWLDLKESRIQ